MNFDAFVRMVPIALQDHDLRSRLKEQFSDLPLPIREVVQREIGKSADLQDYFRDELQKEFGNGQSLSEYHASLKLSILESFQSAPRLTEGEYLACLERIGQFYRSASLRNFRRTADCVWNSLVKLGPLPELGRAGVEMSLRAFFSELAKDLPKMRANDRSGEQASSISETTTRFDILRQVLLPPRPQGVIPSELVLDPSFGESLSVVFGAMRKRIAERHLVNSWEDRDDE